MNVAATTRPRKARRSVQIVGFLRKEIVAVARQPRLLLVLVAGPFLILLLFGIGYDQEQTVLRIKVGIQLASLRRPFRQALHTAAELGAEGVEIDGRNELRPQQMTRTAVRDPRSSARSKASAPRPRSRFRSCRCRKSPAARSSSCPPFPSASHARVVT